MADLADLGMRFTTEGAEAQDRALDNYVDKAGKAEKSQDNLTAAQNRGTSATAQLAASTDRMVREMAKIQAAQAGVTSAVRQGGQAAQQAARHFDTLHDEFERDFVSQYQRSMGGVVAAQSRAAVSSKVLGQATLNLTRQFADVGVSAAMGINPLMILIQQGPQIADAFQQAKAQGAGFKDVMGGLWTTLRPFAGILGAIAIGAAAVGGGFLLATRNINKGHEDLTKGLGLTEDQLEKVKHKSVTVGDTIKATFQVAGRDIYAAFKGPIDSVRNLFTEAFDFITKLAVDFVGGLAGLFVGLYRGIVTTWRQLPAAFGDLMIQAANATLSGVEAVINGIIARVNAFIQQTNDISHRLGHGDVLGELSPVALARLGNQYEGAGAKAGEAFGNAFRDGVLDARKAVNQFFKDVGDQARKNRLAQIMKEAGKGPKDKADPRDTTDERTAQIEAQLAQAKAEELQAQLALTRDVVKRAALEKQVIDQQVAVKQAQLDREIAGIEDDKGLSDAKKEELIGQLEQVKVINEITGILRRRKVDEDASAQLAKDAFNLDVAKREANIELLTSQAALLKSGYARAQVELKILEAQQQIERLKLEEVLASSTSTEAEKAIARARLAVLVQVQENQRQALVDANRLSDAFAESSRRIEDMARAFGDHDWVGLLDKLVDSFKALKEAFGPNGTVGGKVAAVAGIANGVGQAIGGTAGSAISGAASGAMAGFTLGGPAGAAIGAVIGGIGGFLSGSKQKKAEEAARRQQAAEEAAAKAAQVAAQRRDMEIQLMELSGDKLGALTARRADEMAGMDATLRSMAERIYALQDAQERLDQMRSIEVELLQATGRSVEAVAIQRAEELKQVEASLRPLRQAVWAVIDANEAVEAANRAVEAAQDALRAAYQPLLDAANDNVSAAQQKVADAHQRLIDSYNAETQAIKDRNEAAARAVDDARSVLSEAYTREIEAIAARNEAAAAAVATAHDDLIQAYQREAEALQGAISKFKELGDSIHQYAANLGAGPPASPQSQYRLASGQLDEIGRRIQGGDTDALGGFNSAAETFLKASLARAPNLGAYRADENKVRAMAAVAEAAARAQQTDAEKQLSSLNTLVDGVDGVVDGIAHLGEQTLVLQGGVFTTASNVLTVAQAVAKVEQAVKEQKVVEDQGAARKAEVDRIVQGLIDVGGNVLTVEQALAALQKALEEQTRIEQEGRDRQAEIDQLVGPLLDINRGVLSVEQALKELQQAEEALKGAVDHRQQLQDELNALLGLDKSVLSVEEAIAALNRAQAERDTALLNQAAAIEAAIKALAVAKAPPPASDPGPTAPVWTPEGYLAKNPDVLKEYQEESTRDAKSIAYLHQLGINSANDYARWHYNKWGQYEGRAFANGGSFRVGGVGGTDSQLMQFWATPGEMVDVRTPAQAAANGNEGMGDLLMEIRALRAEVAGLRASSEKTAKATDDTSNTLRRVTRDGNSLVTEAA